MSAPRLELPDPYNAATTFVDDVVAGGRGERTAIFYEDRRFTYRQVQEAVNRAGNAFRALGLDLEQRVLLVLPDCPEFAFSFFGAIKVGAVPIPVNPWMKARSYEYLLDDSRARIAVVHESALPEVEAVRRGRRHLRRVVAVGTPRDGTEDWEALLQGQSPELEAEATGRDDVVMWNYTSGSTGEPKGAVHLQHDLVTITDLFVKPVLGMTEDDVCFSASKLFFSYGLGNSLYFPFRFGAAGVLWPERPEPEKVLWTIERYRPTFFFSVPTLYARMLRVEREYDLSSLRVCLSSGEPLPPALFHQWREKAGVELLDVVGSTEATHDFLANRPGRARPGSSGEVTPAFVAKVVDDEGREVPNGQVGNLYVSGDATAPCYWNKHEQTKRTMVGEWLKTGDTYYRDDEGYFWYCGRSDDMLKVGGLWVSPIEVENALMEHPAVLEAAVAGAADGDGLVKPKAYVVPKADRGGADGDLGRELQDFVKDRLEPYKYPRWVEFVDDLPKTETGKIQRFRLREAG